MSVSKIKYYLLCICFVSLLGCESTWDALNRGAAAKDMERMLQRTGVLPKDVSCNMVGQTRAFRCMAKLSKNEDFALIVEKLDLVDEDNIDSMDPCDDFAKGRQTIKKQSRKHRPRDVMDYEYLVAVFDTATKDICFESEYSYG